MSKINVVNVHKKYGPNVVLQGVNLTIAPEEQCALLGASGSGKSTLLYILGGLEVPDSGDVFIGEKNIASMDENEKAIYRNRQVGFVFQFHFLLPSMNSLNNILLPARISGENLKKVEAEVRELAKELGVTHCLEKYPFELSGGEQQRINIIRALSLHPTILLCDEPTGNLDSKNSEKVTSLLQDLAKSFKATLLVVTHSDRVANHFSRKITIEDGQIIR